MKFCTSLLACFLLLNSVSVACDDLVVDLGSFSTKVAKLSSRLNQIEDVNFKDGKEIPTCVALDKSTGKMLVGKEASKSGKFDRIFYFTKLLANQASSNVLNAIKSLNLLSDDQFTAGNAKNGPSFIYNKIQYKIEEFVSLVLSKIVESTSKIYNDRVFIVTDTLKESSKKALTSACELAGLESCQFIDKRLAMAEVTAGYIKPKKQMFLAIDYSFSSLKFALTEGFQDANGVKHSTVHKFKEYDVGAAIGISQIFNHILNEIKAKLPERDLTNEYLTTIREISFEAFKSFSHSLTKKIPLQTLGIELVLKRDEIIETSLLEDSLRDFHDEAKSLLELENQTLDIILFGSACYEQGFQTFLTKTFENSQLITLHDPTRAKARAATRLLKNAFLAKNHKIKLDSGDDTIKLNLGNQSFFEEQDISFSKEYLSEFTTNIMISGLKYVSGKIGESNEVFNCSIDSADNVTEDFALKFVVKQDLKPILKEVSLSNSKTQSVSRKLAFNCQLIDQEGALSDEEFSDSHARLQRAREIDRESKNFKRALNSFVSKIQKYHNLIEELKKSFQGQVDSILVSKMDSFNSIVHTYSEKIDSLAASLIATDIQKFAESLDNDMEVLNSNITYFTKFPDALEELNRTTFVGQTALAKAQNHESHKEMANETADLKAFLSNATDNFNFFVQEFSKAKFLEKPTIPLSDIQTLNFDIYRATLNLQQKQKQIDTEKVLRDVQERYGNKNGKVDEGNSTENNSFIGNHTKLNDDL